MLPFLNIHMQHEYIQVKKNRSVLLKATTISYKNCRVQWMAGKRLIKKIEKEGI